MTGSSYEDRLLRHIEGFLGDFVDRHEIASTKTRINVRVLTWANLFEGCSTHITCGLAERPGRGPGRELVLVHEGEHADAAAMLGRVAVMVHDHGIPIDAGISLRGLARISPSFHVSYDKSALYLADPWPFPDGFAIAHIDDDHHVRFMLATPISEAEHRLVEQRGGDALERRLEAEAVDTFDASRASLV